LRSRSTAATIFARVAAEVSDDLALPAAAGPPDENSAAVAKHSATRQIQPNVKISLRIKLFEPVCDRQILLAASLTLCGAILGLTFSSTLPTRPGVAHWPGFPNETARTLFTYKRDGFFAQTFLPLVVGC
jgi:hypothetical protein